MKSVLSLLTISELFLRSYPSGYVKHSKTKPN
ncbi:MAG: hypothetical protein QOJ15_1335 [Bradyrhizobium sp.]|jgi:hypothetical protein|nr:hypothetical protein [Bradyrhizobium sp.]